MRGIHPVSFFILGLHDLEGEPFGNVNQRIRMQHLLSASQGLCGVLEGRLSANRNILEKIRYAYGCAHGMRGALGTALVGLESIRVREKNEERKQERKKERKLTW